MSRNVHYLETGDDWEIWNSAKDTAADFLINTDEKRRELEAFLVHPLQSTKYDSDGGRSPGISRPTENKACQRLANSVDALEHSRWIEAVEWLERQLNVREKQILAVWRIPKAKGRTKVGLMLEMFGVDEDHEDMREKFVEFKSRCASRGM